MTFPIQCVKAWLSVVSTPGVCVICTCRCSIRRQISPQNMKSENIFEIYLCNIWKKNCTNKIQHINIPSVSDYRFSVVENIYCMLKKNVLAYLLHLTPIPKSRYKMYKIVSNNACPLYSQSLHSWHMETNKYSQAYSIVHKSEWYAHGRPNHNALGQIRFFMANMVFLDII